MRVSAILGLGSSAGQLKLFQSNSDAKWLLGMPTSRDEADAILIFGGDGTLHRHLPQLVKLKLPLLVVPCGSGNDFARALQLSSKRDALAAWQEFSSTGGNVRRLDLGTITPLGPTSALHVHYFCSVGSIGLDAEIARRANALPQWLRGNGGYALSLPVALARFTSQPMRITINEGSPALPDPRPVILAAFANTPIYGGGMKIAPNARFDDGLLDVCVVHGMNKLKLLSRFATIYHGGHLKFAEVEYFRTSQLKVETGKPSEVYADGEYVCQTPVEVGVAAGALTVIVP